MNYFLSIRALGTFPRVAISDRDFSDIESSRATLSAALSQEEIYDILVSNLLDLERELADIAAEDMVRSTHSYEHMFTNKARLARRFANLLTSARIYTDQVPRHFALCMRSEAFRLAARQLLRTSYDTHFAYRFMESFRNHVQHFTATVDSMTMGGSRDSNTMHLGFVVVPFAERAKLALNPKFKRSVLQEMPDHVDLREMARGYVAAISSTHEKLRKEAHATIAAARALIAAHIDTYTQVSGAKPIGLHAFAQDEDETERAIPLLLEWEKTRDWLAARNRPLTDLARHFVTTQLGTTRKSSGPRASRP